MPPREGKIDPGRPPEDLDALIDWFERFSYDLVLLEEFRLSEIRRAVDALEQGVRTHVEAPTSRGPAPRAPGSGEIERILMSDHEWFRTSLDQLEWFYSIVARDDHGGNRQALGQYGRVLAESLRRHRADERSVPRGPGVSRRVGRDNDPPEQS